MRKDQQQDKDELQLIQQKVNNLEKDFLMNIGKNQVLPNQCNKSQSDKQESSNDDIFESFIKNQVGKTTPNEKSIGQYITDTLSKNKKVKKLDLSNATPPTKWVNSQSFQEKYTSLNKKWDQKEIQIFYKLLEIFGTDFTMIHQYLKTKSISQIKNKFNKEEKQNSVKINNIINNPSQKKKIGKLLPMEQLEKLTSHLDQKYVQQNYQMVQRKKSKCIGDGKTSDQEGELAIINVNQENRDRKTSTVSNISNDTVGRLIEDSIVTIYNKEAQLYNEQLQSNKKDYKQIINQLLE